MIGVAGGMALAGMRPIVHTFASFLVERPFEQIKVDLNHQDVGAVLVSSGASFDYSAAGRTHQSPGDVALLSTLPGWTVQVPGHPDEAGTMLRAAAAAGGQVYLRLSGLTNAAPLAGPRRRLHGAATRVSGDDRGRRAAGRRGRRGGGRDGCHRALRLDRTAVRPAHSARDAGRAGRRAGGALPGRHIGGGNYGCPG